MEERNKKLNLQLHREIDKLGKFGLQLEVFFTQPLSESETKHLLDELLSGIANNCFKNGADMIGHIKAHVRTPQGNLRGSVLDPALGAKIDGRLESEAKSMVVTLNVIVHGIWDTEVKEASLRTIQTLGNSRGFHYRLIKEG